MSRAEARIFRPRPSSGKRYRASGRPDPGQDKETMNDGRSPIMAIGAQDNHGDGCCQVHVRLYLRAPFLADEARRINGGQYEGHYTFDITTPGVPLSLQQALQEWVVDESTPDEDIAEFIGWTVERVREHR
ncbi:hypothetical protein Aab01nite_04160 [Paractinoplanes abujensis]|uniref:Uncharacterized protein n=1 Tax=Paractinoplanes abujensis TaxID=882441 RepID=A0A7W7CNE3_9ACTN|nr:hypothetical protein [Actinoplanes abujensis]MBB4691752.1 hypothetical protein [Actinoplanes abujensis]GID16826.1 hypothetical protein Aab01nite_04160 [Actinoplanes abujensis]